MTVHLGPFYLLQGLRYVEGEPEVVCLAVSFDLEEMFEFAHKRSEVEPLGGWVAFRITSEGGLSQDKVLPASTHQVATKAQ